MENTPALPAEVDELNKLYVQQLQLQDILAGSGQHAPLVETALQRAKERIDTLEDSESVRGYYTSLAAPILAELAEIDGLRTYVDTGLIMQDELDAARSTVLEKLGADPVLGAAWRYVNHEKFGQTVQIAHTAPSAERADAPVSAEALTPQAGLNKPQTSEQDTTPETAKPHVKITIRDNGLLIGKNGRYYKTSDVRHQSQRDYTEERLAVLDTLVEHQGEVLTVAQLWEATFGVETPFDRDVMSQVRAWLGKLTFRRQPIVEHNGKRGPASAYGITGFDVQIVKETVTRSKVPTSLPDSVLPAGDVTLPTRSNADTLPFPENSIEQSVKATFPLSLYESSVVATLLDINKPVLRSNEIDTIPVDIVNKLRDKVTKVNAKKIMTRLDCDSIRELRVRAIDRLHTFFEDEDKVLDAIGAMSAKDDRYELFSYLFQMEGEDRVRLLNGLVDAEHSGTADVSTAKFGGYTVTDTKHTIAIDLGDGTEVIEAYGTADLPETIQVAGAVTEIDKEADQQLQPDLELEQRLQEPTFKAEEADKLTALTKSAVTVEQAASPRWEQDFTLAVDEAIVELAAQELINHDNMTAHQANIQSTSRRFGTTEMVNRLAKKGLVKTTGLKARDFGGVELDVYQRVAGWLFNTHEPLFGNRTRKKRAMEIIRQKVDAYLMKTAS